MTTESDFHIQDGVVWVGLCWERRMLDEHYTMLSRPMGLAGDNVVDPLTFIRAGVVVCMQ